MNKIFTSFIFVIVFTGLMNTNMSIVAAQDIDGIAVTVSYPDPIPAGTTYNQVIPDDGLASCMAIAQDQTANDYVSEESLAAITTTKKACQDQNISDLTGLEYMTNIEHLNLFFNQISDLTPISDLTKITYLSLGDNNISDLTPISNMTGLQSLFLHNNDITDIEPLANMTNLQELTLNNQDIQDISVISNMPHLTYLNLQNTNTTDISALANLNEIELLGLNNNNISDLTPLANNSSVSSLNLSGNNISDVSPLANLTNISSLDLSNNHIADISPLASLPTIPVVNNQTIDLGLIHGNVIEAPITSYSSYNPPHISPDVTYYFTMDEYYDSNYNTIHLNSNYGTDFTFSAGDYYDGTVSFTRED